MKYTVESEQRIIFAGGRPVASLVITYCKDTMIGRISLCPIIRGVGGMLYTTHDDICLSHISYEVPDIVKLLNDTYDEISVKVIDDVIDICINYNYIHNISIMNTNDAIVVCIFDEEGNVIETPIKYSVILDDNYIAQYKQNGYKWMRTQIVHSNIYKLNNIVTTRAV